METSEKFSSLFSGNVLAIGTEEGGCVHIDNSYQDWWQGKILAHLAGYEPVGVYPVMAPGVVRWGCVDWDTGPGDWQYAVDTQKVIEVATGAVTWIEASRSKGFHLWWFLKDLVPMASMRKALLAACQISGAPTREINPKQMELAEGQLGNYVRLPYPGMDQGPLRDGYHGRTVYLPDKTALTYHEFVEEAWECRSTCEQVDLMASYYVEPIRVIPKYTPLQGDVYERLHGLARVMWSDGPLDFDDRSSKIYRFACLVAEAGRHTPEEVCSLVKEFDLKWFDPPKYANRDDGEQRIGELVERAFTE